MYNTIKKNDNIHYSGFDKEHKYQVGHAWFMSVIIFKKMDFLLIGPRRARKSRNSCRDIRK